MRHIALCLIVLLTGCVEDQRFIDEEIFVDSDVEPFEDSDIDFDRDVETDLEPFDADELPDAEEDVEADVEADVEVDTDMPVDADPPDEIRYSWDMELVGDNLFVITTEVTREQFFHLLGYDPTSASANPFNRPAETVSPVDAMRYANALSEEHLLPLCYNCVDWYCAIATTPIEACAGFRLPIENEWSTFVGSDPGGAVSGATAPVGSLAPNDLDIYDMLGNVWELCHSTLSPTGFAARGGGWGTPSDEMRASLRIEVDLIATSPYVGFRLVRSVVD